VPFINSKRHTSARCSARSPTLGSLPLKLGTLSADDPYFGPLEWLQACFTLAPFTALYNMTAQPAISLPLAESRCGLPMGVQFVAPFGDEATLFNLAGQLEVMSPWAQRKPGVHVASAPLD
jgi:amidase